MKSRGGFTIVELLVVITVIGILASITVVTYNGIQDRAYSTKAQALVHTYETALRIYKAQHGDYPRYANDEDPNVWVCLGTTEQFPAADGFAAGTCETWSGPTVVTDETFMSELGTVMDSPVSGRLPVINYGGGRARSVEFYRSGPSIDYYVKDTASACPVGIKEITPGGTRCVVRIEG